MNRWGLAAGVAKWRLILIALGLALAAGATWSIGAVRYLPANAPFTEPELHSLPASQNPYFDPATPSPHPRIFFSSTEVAELSARAQTTEQEVWKPILAFARNELKSKTPAMPASGNLDGFRNEGNKMIAIAFAFVVTGDPTYLQLARRNLLAYAGWDYWGDDGKYGNRLLGFHHMLLGVAIAYDWVYVGLSDADRATIQAALARRAQESFEAGSRGDYIDDWANWWRRAYVQNHHWVNNSALGMVALVLQSEDPRSSQWLNQAVAQMEQDREIAEGIGDGSWHEGLAYQSYALTLSLPFMYNLRRITGQDILPHRYLRNYALWRIYNSLPNSARFALSYGDLDWSWANGYQPQNLLRFTAREYGDSRAQWEADELVRGADPRSLNSGIPWRVFELLYHDPTVPSKGPSGLPLGRTFPDLEGVIWRTGWGDRDLTFALKTGAYGGRFAFDGFTASPQASPWDHPGIDTMSNGHDHDDANSFYLYRGSTDLASENASYGGSATGLHNTLLIDGAGQYRDPDEFAGMSYWDMKPEVFRGSDGRLEASASTPSFDYLIADATDRYRARDPLGRPGDRKVDEFRRYVLFVRPGYLVMVDNVQATAAHQYEWVSHFGGAASLEGDWIKAPSANNQVLGVKVLSPTPFAASIGSDGKPFIRLRPASNVASTRFVTVLYPTDSPGWDARPPIELLANTDQGAALRVEQKGTQDHLFRYGAEDSVTLAGYALNGRVASVIRDGSGAIQRLFLGQGSTLAQDRGDRPLIEATGEVAAVEAGYSGSAVTVTMEGDPGTGLRIYAPDADPARVTLNGQPVVAAREGQYILIK